MEVRQIDLKQKQKQLNNIEKRIYKLPDLTLRQEPDMDMKRIEGYALMYNKHSVIMYDWWGDPFVERFAVGAFSESLQTRDQKALWNHNWSKPLGSIKAGTLDLMDRQDGLFYMIMPPNNTWGNDAITSIERGDVDGTSIAFMPKDDVYKIIEMDGMEVYERTILKAKLYEVSPCTRPAYPDSTSEARSLIKCREHCSQMSKEQLRREVLKTKARILGGIK